MKLAAVAGPRCSRATPSLREAPQRQSMERIGRETIYRHRNAVQTKPATSVFKLDRLGRTVRQLIKLVDELRQRDIGLRSLADSTDVAVANGWPFMQTMAALSEMERSLMRERTQVALAVAKARGREGGRRPKLTALQIEQVKNLLANRTTNVSEVAASFGVARSTLYRAMERASAARAD